MYTFPFATVGTVNFTAFPALSRLKFCELFHNSVAEVRRIVSVQHRRPPAGAFGVPLVPYFPVSMAQTIPFSVAEDAEIDGDAPANPNPVGVADAAVVLNIPFDVLNV